MHLQISQQAPPAFAGARLLHTMLRVHDLQRSLAFYVDRLGMTLWRRQDFPRGQFTLAFVGFGTEEAGTVLELTHNGSGGPYAAGTGFGHVAIGVPDLYEATRWLAEAGVPVTRAPGPLDGDPGELIAFVEDPDGYCIELIQRPPQPPIQRPPSAADTALAADR
jgi:lactoylglutathione lyase